MGFSLPSEALGRMHDHAMMAGALKIDLSGVADVIMSIGGFVQDVLSFAQNAVDSVYGVVRDVDDALGRANDQVMR
jgi:hypothetical protein